VEKESHPGCVVRGDGDTASAGGVEGRGLADGACVAAAGAVVQGGAAAGGVDVDVAVAVNLNDHDHD
jgi:hypothetical protein